LWNPPNVESFHTKGIIHPIQLGRFTSYVLEIPAIQRYKVIPEWIEEI
jgi:hypothetical protein